MSRSNKIVLEFEKGISQDPIKFLRVSEENSICGQSLFYVCIYIIYVDSKAQRI